MKSHAGIGIIISSPSWPICCAVKRLIGHGHARGHVHEGDIAADFQSALGTRIHLLRGEKINRHHYIDWALEGFDELVVGFNPCRSLGIKLFDHEPPSEKEHRNPEKSFK